MAVQQSLIFVILTYLLSRISKSCLWVHFRSYMELLSYRCILNSVEKFTWLNLSRKLDKTSYMSLSSLIISAIVRKPSKLVSLNRSKCSTNSTGWVWKTGWISILKKTSIIFSRTTLLFLITMRDMHSTIWWTSLQFRVDRILDHPIGVLRLPKWSLPS